MHKSLAESHENLNTTLLAAIDRAQLPSGAVTKIVAIDGGGGAGKSTLAQHLSAWLGGAPVISTDDFASWGVPLEWWPRLLEQVLKPLAAGQSAHYQRYDWGKLELTEWRSVAPGGVIILEGVSSLRREFRPYLAYRIWIEVSPELRLKRGLARDRGIEGENNRDRWLKWQAAEIKHFKADQPELAADIIINGETEAYHYHAKEAQP